MKRFLLLFMVTLGLTACGGGGGDSASVVATPTGTVVDLAPMKSVFFGTSAGSQFNFPSLTGTDSQGRSWSGSFTVVADGATTFEGQNVTKRRTLTTLQLAGGTPVSSVSTAYYFVTNGAPYKSVDSSGVTYLPTSYTAIPVPVKVGDFGVLGTFDGSNNTNTSSIWTLNPDYNGASQLNLSATIKTGTTVTGIESDVYYLDAAGIPTKVHLNVTTNGITINLYGNKN
jgi:hypothetical protein